MALQPLIRIKTRITRHKQHIVAMDRILFQLEHLLPEVAVDVFVHDRGSGSTEVVPCVGHGCVLAAGGGMLGEGGESEVRGWGRTLER